MKNEVIVCILLSIIFPVTIGYVYDMFMAFVTAMICVIGSSVFLSVINNKQQLGAKQNGY